jgi:hypothetical protein
MVPAAVEHKILIADRRHPGSDSVSVFEPEFHYVRHASFLSCFCVATNVILISGLMGLRGEYQKV